MCGSKVDLLLGDFRNQGALTAISELVGTFKEVASLDGDVLPEDLRAAYDKVHATSPKMQKHCEDAASDRVRNSLFVRMSQLNWWMSLVAEVVVETL